MPWLLNAFFLNNSLFGKGLQIFTHGHRALNASILKHFEWYENMQVVLDWYHLHKKKFFRQIRISPKKANLSLQGLFLPEKAFFAGHTTIDSISK
jgi:hypothetical protein